MHYARFLPALFALSASCAFAQSPIFKDMPSDVVDGKPVADVSKVGGAAASESGGEKKQASFSTHTNEAKRARAALRARLEQKKRAAKARLEKADSLEKPLPKTPESVQTVGADSVAKTSEAETAASLKAQRLENKRAIAKAKADAAKKAEAARAAEGQSRPSAGNAKSGSVFDSIFPF